MANFIEKTLEPGEQVIFKGRLHWSYNFMKYTMPGIALILVGLYVLIYYFNESTNEEIDAFLYISGVLFLIGLCFIAFGYFIRTKTEFAITNTRFIQKDGILNIKMTEIPLFKIETVNFYQNISERMLGTGSIELVGSGGTTHKVSYVQRPYEVRNLIATYMKENKKDPNENKQS